MEQVHSKPSSTLPTWDEIKRNTQNTMRESILEYIFLVGQARDDYHAQRKTIADRLVNDDWVWKAIETLHPQVLYHNDSYRSKMIRIVEAQVEEMMAKLVQEKPLKTSETQYKLTNAGRRQAEKLSQSAIDLGMEI